MSKCPKCGKDIEKLKEYDLVWHEYKLEITPEGEEYTDVGVTEQIERIEFECPECSNVLFYNTKDAINFLSKEVEDDE